MRLEQAIESHEVISPPNGLLDFAMKKRNERWEEREARGTQTREVGRQRWERVKWEKIIIKMVGNEGSAGSLTEGSDQVLRYGFHKK